MVAFLLIERAGGFVSVCCLELPYVLSFGKKGRSGFAGDGMRVLHYQIPLVPFI